MIEVEQGIVFVDLAQGTGKMSAAGCAVDSLFCRFTVEVLVVGFRVGASVVAHAVPVIRRRIKRVELEGNTAGIDDAFHIVSP
jgi:hypothetical protein